MPQTYDRRWNHASSCKGPVHFEARELAPLSAHFLVAKRNAAGLKLMGWPTHRASHLEGYGVVEVFLQSLERRRGLHQVSS
jgi:hypothetical protein